MALSVVVHGITTQTGTQTAGRWAAVDVTSSDGSDNLIYTVPSYPGFDYAMAAISICNRASAGVSQVSIAIVPAEEIAPLDEHFVEWNTPMVPNGVLERTQMILSPSDKIFVRVGQP